MLSAAAPGHKKFCPGSTVDTALDSRSTTKVADSEQPITFATSLTV